MKRAEKTARLTVILSKFKRKELKHPVTRKSFEGTVKNLYGAKHSRKVIKALEDSGIIPKAEEMAEEHRQKEAEERELLREAEMIIR